jgi:hypothetical protein
MLPKSKETSFVFKKICLLFYKFGYLLPFFFKAVFIFFAIFWNKKYSELIINTSLMSIGPAAWYVISLFFDCGGTQWFG